MKRSIFIKKILSVSYRMALIFVSIAILWQNSSAAENRKAVIGADGWLIYTEKKDVGNLFDYKKSGTLDEIKLTIRGKRMERLSDWLAHKGVTFILTVAPNTPTIYPESVPRHIKVVGKVSRLDQMSRFLQEKTHVNFLDLRPPLLEAKKEQVIYYKTDTHWNVVGAFVVYQELMHYMQKLRPFDANKLVPMELSDFNMEKKVFSGDLARMLGLQDTLKEEIPVIVPKTAYKAVRTWIEGESSATENRTVCPGLKLLVFKDSYFNNVQPYISEHFCQATYILLLGVEKHFIEKYNPDIVIFETAERYLSYLKNVPDMN